MPSVGAYMGLGYGGAVYQQDNRSSNADAMMQQYTRQCSGMRADGLEIGAQNTSYFIRPINPEALFGRPPVDGHVANPAPGPYVQPPLRTLPPSQMFHEKFNDPQYYSYSSPHRSGVSLTASSLPVPPNFLDTNQQPAPQPSAPPPSSSSSSSPYSMPPLYPPPIIPKNEVEAARSRALQVVQRFQKQEQEDLERIESSELGRKRKAFFQRFSEKLRLAMVKNLEYVSRVEDERLQKKLALAQQAEAYHMQVEDYHNQILELRSQNLRTLHGIVNNNNNNNNSQAGIGTQQREKQEKKRKQQTIANDSVAIYISNLPKDGSASDELMRALFGSYGTLRKIHFYHDKKTGELKGDALVIYNVDDVAEKSELTDTVCSQMNGAELPCGTVLMVEPSDPLYALRKKKQQAAQYGPAGAIDASNLDEAAAAATKEEPKLEETVAKKQRTTAEAKAEVKEAGDGGDDDDDLDDFFASL